MEMIKWHTVARLLVGALVGALVALGVLTHADLRACVDALVEQVPVVGRP